MHMEWGLLLPIPLTLTSQTNYKPVFIKAEDFGVKPSNRFYFSPHNEEETVRLFLDAVRGGDDDPRVYLSRGFAESIDLGEIKDYFGKLSCYTRLQRLETAIPGKRKTNSILVMEENTIFHLHMRWEPRVGLWKICGIEKE